jgi:hypothetical protein
MNTGVLNPTAIEEADNRRNYPDRVTAMMGKFL